MRIGRHKVVYITYEIVDEHGALFERSDIPIGYVHGGQGPLIEKLEHSLEGRAVGDSVEVEVSPAEGFGEHHSELTFTDDIENVPPEYRRLGAEVLVENEQGEQKRLVVTRIENGRLTVDGNHPLAGQTVTYRIKVADIREASPEEMASGQPADAPVSSIP